MNIQFAKPEHIDAWMALVEQVRDAFPGLETAEAMAEHRVTVLQFMQSSSAIWTMDAGRAIGALLFSKGNSVLCFLAVDPAYRRRHIDRQMVDFMLTQMEEGRTSPSPPTGRATPTGWPPGPSTSAWAFPRAD